MTYGVIFTLLCIIAGVFAVVALFRRTMPSADELRVAWPQSPTPPVVRPRPTLDIPRLPMLFTGPDRYCPECGRLLVKIHQDGTFDLSGQAGVQATGELVIENGVPTTSGLEALVIEATCLLCHPEEGP